MAVTQNEGEVSWANIALWYYRHSYALIAIVLLMILEP
jgi:hypothetical protein